mgnify:FL=1
MYKRQISTYKSRYEEVNAQLEETNKTISEYETRIESNQEASELLDEELKQSQLLLGKTNVVGEGVVVTLTDNDEYSIVASDLLDLVNELRFAGAEAISINGIRILNMTEIADIYGYIIVTPNQRLVSPYVVKAIGNQTYLTSTLSLKNTGFIDSYTSSGRSVTLEQQRNIEIPKYEWEIEANYMKEVTE